MNLIDALEKTADLVESRPSAWNFMSVLIPENLEGAGCAIGWISYFRGCPGWDGHIRASQALDGMESWPFYGKLDEIQKGWEHDPVVALRGYAAKLRNSNETL